MKALCVNENRNLQLRNISFPSAPPSGYVTVNIAAAAINHGDKTFLKIPDAAGGTRGTRLENVWGASAAGVVTQIGADVPAHYLGRQVAIYKNLQPNRSLLGLWCETAQVPYLSTLLLPDDVNPLDYSGSLVNVVTAYAFLEQAMAEGHRGIVVTAGSSATGRAMVALARRRGIPTLVIVRSAASRLALIGHGVSHVLASEAPEFLGDFEQAARELGTTAVFDGVGGTLLSRIVGVLPTRSTIFFYGFLSGAEQVSFHSSIFMMKDTIMKRFSNFDSPTVCSEKNLIGMLKDLENCIEEPLFRTDVGQTFDLADFEAAMAYKGINGGKATFVRAK